MARSLSKDRVARARCAVATAEIALVSRDLGGLAQTLDEARAVLDAHGDAMNAAHAGYLDARRLLLIGRLADAERIIGALDAEALPGTSKTGYWLVVAGIAMRRIQAGPARTALGKARLAARRTGIPALLAEAERAMRLFAAPAARWITRDGGRPLALAEVEALLASNALIIDACHRTVRAGTESISLDSRPVLLILARTLAQAWPEDVPRETLLRRAFRARDPDESYRARLRVEIGRLRKALKPVAELYATPRGYRLAPGGPGPVVVLAPPADGQHADLLALLADGEAWSSSALALALGVGTRSVQRALEALSQAGDRLNALDPDSGTIVEALDVAADAGTAFDGKHLFQISGAVIRKIDPRTGRTLAVIPTPGRGDASGLAWAEGALWVGLHRGRRILQVDPDTGAVLRSIECSRFVTGVTWVDGELWHGTWQDDASGIRRIDPATGDVLERLDMPAGSGVSGLESDAGDRFFCGGGNEGTLKVVRRGTRD